MVLTLRTSSAAASRFDFPFATSRATESSAGVSRSRASTPVAGRVGAAGRKLLLDARQVGRGAEPGERRLRPPEVVDGKAAPAGAPQTCTEVGLDQRSVKKLRKRL